MLGGPNQSPTATGGFPYLSEMIGSAAPTGTPVAIPGYLPIVVGTDGKVYVFGGGAWQQVGGGGGTKTLTNYTGTTTAGGVTVFDVSDANGIGGVVSIENTGASFSMDYSFTATDMFGFVAAGSGPVTLTPGTKDQIDLHTGNSLLSACPAPYKEFKLTITDHIGGSHTTFSVYKLQY